jgi:hypothetical protein
MLGLGNGRAKAIQGAESLNALNVMAECVLARGSNFIRDTSLQEKLPGLVKLLKEGFHLSQGTCGNSMPAHNVAEVKEG